MQSPAQKLLDDNVEWAKEFNERHPGFLPSLVDRKQHPDLLWFGCSDSGVPESVITASKPGRIFTHRNIANQFHLTDDSAVSVLDYAVGSLKVTEVAIVGHTNCGGADACFNEPPGPNLTPALTRWLTPLIKLARDLHLPGSPDRPAALQKLVEENVKVQVGNLIQTETIKNAWDSGTDVTVHGWFYDLRTGLIHDMGTSVGRDGPIRKEK